MKLRSLFLILVLLGYQSTASAIAISAEQLKGWYVSIAAAENLFYFGSRYTFDPSKVNNPNSYAAANNLNTSNLNPMFALGYTKQVDRYHAGFEVTSNLNNIQRSQVTQQTNLNRYILNTTYSLLGRFGVEFHEKTIAYGLIGLAFSQLQRQIIFAGTYQPLNLAMVNQCEYVWGPALGMGFDHAYDNHWHVGAEYQHVFFGTTRFDLQHNIFKFLGNVGTNSVNFSQGIVALKLSYYV